MTRQTCKNRINKILTGTAKGFFSDEYWQGVKQVWDALDAAGYEVEHTGAKYDHDENGNPSHKTWTFQIAFGSKPIYGIVVAAGAGTVLDPLARYDVTAYVS